MSYGEDVPCGFIAADKASARPGATGKAVRATAHASSLARRLDQAWIVAVTRCR